MIAWLPFARMKSLRFGSSPSGNTAIRTPFPVMPLWNFAAAICFSASGSSSGCFAVPQSPSVLFTGFTVFECADGARSTLVGSATLRSGTTERTPGFCFSRLISDDDNVADTALMKWYCLRFGACNLRSSSAIGACARARAADRAVSRPFPPPRVLDS